MTSAARPTARDPPALLERLGDEDALPLPGRQLADVAVGDRHDLKTFHGLLHDAAVVDREAPEQALRRTGRA